MKTNKILLAIFLVLLIAVSATSVSATSPPYSMQFDAETEMLASLSEYATSFPNVDGYIGGELGQPREGYHLEEKEVIVPKISDDGYTAESFCYADSSWGSGVNCIFTSYSKSGESNSIRILTYYHLNKNSISNSLDSIKYSSDDEVIYESKNNEYPYVAYNSYDEKGEFVRCTYEIAVGECLVIVYSEEQYNENFVSNINMESKDIMLPVYVQNDVENTDELLGDVNEDVNACFNPFVDYIKSEHNLTEIYEDEVCFDFAVMVDDIYVFRATYGGSPDLCTSQKIGDYLFTYGAIYGDEELNPTGVYALYENNVIALSEAFDKGIVDMDKVYDALPENTGTYRYGDADMDGKLTIKDATFIQKYIAKYEEVRYKVLTTEHQSSLLNFNQDNKTNIKDATAIQKYLAKIDI